MYIKTVLSVQIYLLLITFHDEWPYQLEELEVKVKFLVTVVQTGLQLALHPRKEWF